VREIKFRAWDKRFNNMVYAGAMAILYLNDKDHEIMQFTGLHDSNGKKIWEGDIIRIPREKDIWQIRWHYHGFCLSRKRKPHTVDWGADEEGYINYSRLWEEIEVIGNLYENPELVKEKP